MKTGGKKDQEKKKNAWRKYEKKEPIQKRRESKKRSGKNDFRPLRFVLENKAFRNQWTSELCYFCTQRNHFGFCCRPITLFISVLWSRSSKLLTVIKRMSTAIWNIAPMSYPLYTRHPTVFSNSWCRHTKQSTLGGLQLISFAEWKEIVLVHSHVWQCALNH